MWDLAYRNRNVSFCSFERDFIADFNLESNGAASRLK